MAELTTSYNRKVTPKVDLTAMVDLAFLLITFFMLTTSLSKPVAMDIAKPIIDPVARLELPASRTMTILLGKNNQLAWYMGESEKSIPKVEDYHTIRRSIQLNEAMVAKANNFAADRGLVVIVKPTRNSSYKNFVDIMDELNVAKINTAPAIDDEHFSDAELAFLVQKNL
jgi:biopolymer transport protein ExbD